MYCISCSTPISCSFQRSFGIPISLGSALLSILYFCQLAQIIKALNHYDFLFASFPLLIVLPVSQLYLAHRITLFVISLSLVPVHLTFLFSSAASNHNSPCLLSLVVYHYFSIILSVPHLYLAHYTPRLAICLV